MRRRRELRDRRYGRRANRSRPADRRKKMSWCVQSTLTSLRGALATKQSSLARCFWIASHRAALCADPARNDGPSTLRLLRLPLLYRPAGVAPGGKAAAEMRNRLQPHVLCGFRRQRRTQAAGAMKDEFLVALEDRLGIGTLRIDPELQ